MKKSSQCGGQDQQSAVHQRLPREGSVPEPSIRATNNPQQGAKRNVGFLVGGVFRRRRGSIEGGFRHAASGGQALRTCRLGFLAAGEFGVFLGEKYTDYQASVACRIGLYTSGGTGVSREKDVMVLVQGRGRPSRVQCLPHCWGLRSRTRGSMGVAYENGSLLIVQRRRERR